MFLRVGFIAVVIFVLNGCGFHLRKPNPAHLEQVNVQFTSNCPRFENQFHAYFASYGIDVRENLKPDASTPSLRLDCPILDEQPLVYDGEGQLRRERLKLRLTAEFNQQPLPLSAIRERQLNSNQPLADNNEKSLIVQEMQEDILYKLLSHLSKS